MATRPHTLNGIGKTLCLSLAALLTACMLTGCQSGTDSLFTAQNEIYTYQKIDPNKTQLTLSTLGNNANLIQISEAFETANPDVQIIKKDITGGNDDYRPTLDWLANGIAPDIIFINQDTLIDDEMVVRYFENLSANPVIENFELSALSRAAVNSNIYLLPCPSEINCITYNKTLFDQYGWKVPATFDQFVALSNQIRQDTNGAIQPWNPNAKYDSIFTIATEAFVYEALFGGLDNRGWYQDFCDGKATFAGHMEPYYAMLQTLIDNGILLEEHFSYSATTRGKEFAAGQIAMINGPVSHFTSEEYEVDCIPYPGTQGEVGYLNDSFSALMGVPAKERTDKQRDAVNRFVAFFGSVEGQQALIGDTLMVSNVKNVPLTHGDFGVEIQKAMAQGRKFSRMDFSGVGQRNWTFTEQALSMTLSEKTGADCIAEVDAKPYSSSDESAAKAVHTIATVAEDFTVLEFSNYIADMYREKAGADIGLINNNIAFRGNLIRLFKGELLNTYVQVLLPRSFDNNSALVKASLTGRQLLDALNHPVGNNCVSDSIYAFSGLKCQIAPWNELGQKYLSVKLADGTAIDPDKLYTVAFWAGTVADEYVTEILETYEGAWVELMTAKMIADKTLAPAKDGRVTLKWN